jgi:hypothetical protein
MNLSEMETALPEDIGGIREAFPGITMHYK